MREIKFRFYDNKDKEMIAPTKNERKDIIFEKWEFNPKASELMQYTGLKDKNGTEIYEGDIVQTGWQGNEKGVVVFESSTYCVDSGNGYMYFNHPESYEVIGNIYENPELLGDSQ